MKKDNMLNEGTIRRFMKLATIDGLSDKFVEEKLQEGEEQELEERGGMKPKRDDEEMRESDEDIEEGKHEDEEKVEEAADEELDEMGGEMPMDRDEEEGEMEMDMDLDMGAEEPAAEAGGMVSVDQLMSALEKALEDVLGQEVEVSQDDEEAEMDMDLDMDAPDAEPAMDLGDDAEEEEEEEELEEATPKTDVVEEVYARVIQRLTQETKSNKK
jgi:hypothetical protein